MRTEGSLTKAPAVVCRPVQSISWRSIIRTGETVFVPIGSSFTRCGISEPVTKTVFSSTFCLRFGAWLLVGSASTVPANMLVTTTIIAIEGIEIFTTTNLNPRGCYAQVTETMMMEPFRKSERGNGFCHCPFAH